MDQDKKQVGEAIGLVRIDAVEVTVTPLSQAEERSLDRALQRAAEADAGDHYTRCKPELDALKDSPADRIEFLREIARLSAKREPLSLAAMIAFRDSPAGVAIELYHRGRRATPGLTLAALRAVVTDVNVDEVASALLDLIEGGDPKPTR